VGQSDARRQERCPEAGHDCPSARAAREPWDELRECLERRLRGAPQKAAYRCHPEQADAGWGFDRELVDATARQQAAASMAHRESAGALQGLAKRGRYPGLRDQQLARTASQLEVPELAEPQQGEEQQEQPLLPKVRERKSSVQRADAQRAQPVAWELLRERADAQLQEVLWLVLELSLAVGQELPLSGRQVWLESPRKARQEAEPADAARPVARLDACGQLWRPLRVLPFLFEPRPRRRRRLPPGR